MSRRGFPSTAHEYNARGECIHCGMYRINVEETNHECMWWRENFVDKLGADAANMSIEDWRLGRDLEPRKAEMDKLQKRPEGESDGERH